MFRKGQRLFSRKEWDQLLDALDLTGRQAQVLRHLITGRGDKQIAYALRISVPTVRTHLRRLFTRFNVQDRCELIVTVFARFRTLSSDGRIGNRPDRSRTMTPAKHRE